MDQDPLNHGASAPSSRSWKRLSLPYGLLYGLQHLVLFCQYAMTLDTCHGPGARYPGGCPAYAQRAWHQQRIFLGLGLVIMGVCISSVGLGIIPWRYRRLVLLGYGLFLVLGPLVAFVPHQPR